jgi:hypothetical protein
MGRSPRLFLERFEPKRKLRTFAGFKHCFNDGRDLCAFLLACQTMLREADSAEGWLLAFTVQSSRM